MERIKNEVSFAGRLIKNNLKLANNDSGIQYISGNLIIRTTDGSEHIINVYCDSIKSKYENKIRTYTGEENLAFNGLKTIMSYQGLDTNPESNIILSSNSGTYAINDYINKNNELKSIPKISATYMTSKLDNIDVNNLECLISLNGIIQEITQEIINDESTGNYIINFLVLDTKGGWKKGSTDAELDKCYPVQFLLPQKLVDGFQECGYYEGCYCNLVAKVININKTEQIITKQGFGRDKVEIFTTIKNCNEIISGGLPIHPSQINIEQSDIDALLNKRELMLKEIKEKGYLGKKTSDNQSPNNLINKPNVFAQNNSINSTSNKLTGFGGFNGAKNPFAK